MMKKLFVLMLVCAFIGGNAVLAADKKSPAPGGKGTEKKADASKKKADASKKTDSKSAADAKKGNKEASTDKTTDKAKTK